MEESCALCEKRAMMLCDSDQAKLCWECDEKVHSANFLVAKHSRVLLCRFCHSPTPWKASGTKLTPTVSFCHRCLANRRQPHRPHCVQDVDVDVYDDDDDDDDDESEGEDEEEEEKEKEEGDNQVVPMSSGSTTSPPSAAGLAFKRFRNHSFSLDSHDEAACSSSEMLSAALPSDESTSVSVLKRYRVHD